MEHAVPINWPWAVALAAIAGLCGSVLTICTLCGVCWRYIQGLVKREQAVADVPTLRSDLKAHAEQDERRFDEVLEKLQGLDRKMDVAVNDIGWIKRQNGGR